VNAKSMLKHVRLLPAIMALGGTLFVIKAAGLVHDAQAQAASMNPTTVAAQPASTAQTIADGDDSESSSSEVDVLTSLSKRRAELDMRERELRTQQDLIVAAEKRVDDKIASLKTLQSQIQGLLAERDTVQQKQVDSLVKTYSAMKPRDAARIFNSLDETVLIAVASQIKPDVLAPILAQMQSEPAQKLTLKLADRLKLPDPPPPPVQPIQTASALPTSTQASAPGAAASLPAAIPATTPPATAPASKSTSPATPTPAAAGK
jgi:flagellar motility protein MotE (MotC chaperone)